KPVRFLGAGFYGFGGDVLVELDDLQSHLSLFSNSGARIIGSLDQISELGSQCPRRRWTHQSRSRGPDPRPANFAEIGSVPLGQGPLVVVLRNIGARGYAEMKIELTHEIKQVTVAVDESWKNRFPFDVDDAALFQLIDHRSVDKTLRFRQRRFVLKLGFNQKLDGFQGRTRDLLNGRCVVLPRPLQKLIVGDLAVFAQNPFAEFLIRAITVHAANEPAHKAHRRIALLREKRLGCDNGPVDVLKAEVGKLYQLSHAEFCRFRIKRVTQRHDLDSAAL